ncbi:MAG: energy transducer TonB [Burkholderiales bacterium]
MGVLMPLSASGKRLGLALLASLALHLALLLGVRVKSVAAPEAEPAALQVRLVSVKPEQAQAGTAKTEPIPKPALKQDSPQPIAPKPQAEHGDSAAVPTPPQHSAPPAADVLDARPSLDIPLVDAPTYYPSKQLDIQPAALQPIKPIYPDEAAQRNIQGSVVLLLLIDESGTVREASVVEAKPEGYFEETALSAFRQARFRPAERKGRVVKSRVLIRVSFELTGR